MKREIADFALMSSEYIRYPGKVGPEGVYIVIYCCWGFFLLFISLVHKWIFKL